MEEKSLRTTHFLAWRLPSENPSRRRENTKGSDGKEHLMGQVPSNPWFSILFGATRGVFIWMYMITIT